MKRMITTKEVENIVENSIAPLYRHSIAIKGSDCSFAIMIINNSDTALEDAADIIEEIHEYDIFAPVVGAIVIGVDEWLHTTYAIYNETDNDYYLRGITNEGVIEDGSSKISLKFAIEHASFLLDDVHRLN